MAWSLLLRIFCLFQWCLNGKEEFLEFDLSHGGIPCRNWNGQGRRRFAWRVVSDPDILFSYRVVPRRVASGEGVSSET